MRRSIVMGLTGVVLGLWLLSPGWAETVGKTTVVLDAIQTRTGESALGDVVADAVRAAATTPEFTAEAALVMTGSLRPRVIPVGEVTREQLTSVLVYPEDQVVGVELKGSELLAALEWGLSFTSKKNAARLQVSGMTVSYRSDAPAGKRLAEVKVGGAALVPGRTYRVAMPLTLAKGAEGYFRVFGEREVKLSGPSLKEALARYVQLAGTVPPMSGQRVRDLSQPAAK